MMGVWFSFAFVMCDVLLSLLWVGAVDPYHSLCHLTYFIFFHHRAQGFNAMPRRNLTIWAMGTLPYCKFTYVILDDQFQIKHLQNTTNLRAKSITEEKELNFMKRFIIKTSTRGAEVYGAHVAFFSKRGFIFVFFATCYSILSCSAAGARAARWFAAMRLGVAAAEGVGRSRCSLATSPSGGWVIKICLSSCYIWGECYSVAQDSDCSNKQPLRTESSLTQHSQPSNQPPSIIVGLRLIFVSQTNQRCRIFVP